MMENSEEIRATPKTIIEASLALDEYFAKPTRFSALDSINF